MDHFFQLTIAFTMHLACCIGHNAHVSVKDHDIVDDRCSVELKLLDLSIDHPVGSAFHRVQIQLVERVNEQFVAPRVSRCRFGTLPLPVNIMVHH